MQRVLGLNFDGRLHSGYFHHLVFGDLNVLHFQE